MGKIKQKVDEILYIRKHSYSSKFGRDIQETGGMYSRCIHCGETIGQGWYGTPDSKCVKRLNTYKIQEFCDFMNYSIADWDIKPRKIFCIKRYSDETFTFSQFKNRLMKLYSNVK